MSARSRVAFGSGAAAAVGAALLLSGGVAGSVALAVLLAVWIRSAALASLVDAGPILAAGALRGLRDRLWIAPAWALAAAAAATRAGSGSLADVRGANAIAGAPLAYGPTLTVVGSWLAFAGILLTLAGRWSVEAETGGPPGATGRIVPPGPVRRLEAAGVILEIALAASLFVGPQIVRASDATWWAIAIAAMLAVVWHQRRRAVHVAVTPPAAVAAAGAGFALVLLGGAP